LARESIFVDILAPVPHSRITFAELLVLTNKTNRT
jgi:hypothetical protein